MEHQIMMRLAKFLLVLNVCFLYANSDENTIRSNVVYEDSESTNVTSESLKCEGVEGPRLSACSECYPCDGQIVENHRALGHEIKELKLHDVNCRVNETICCIRASDSVFSAMAPDTALCAAVYVDSASRMLLTTASCVHGKRPHELQVRFDELNLLDVQRIDVHEGFNKATDENNMAALRVKNVPEWAKPVCLPAKPAPDGSSCVAVADNSFSLSQAIPNQSKCKKDNKPLYSSLMCTAPFGGDDPPEQGGGVFCADEQAPQLVYSVYGLYLRSEDDGLVAINVNVTHFFSWITNKGKEYKNI